MKLIGIDLTSSEKKASGVVIRENGRYDYGLAKTDYDIIKTCVDADLVAIDAPLRLSKGYCCLEIGCNCHEGKPMGRSCERELSKRGIPLYFTTKKTIIKKMIYRAMNLADIIGRNKVIEIGKYTLVTCIIRVLSLQRHYQKVRILQIFQQGQKISYLPNPKHRAIPTPLETSLLPTPLVFLETLALFYLCPQKAVFHYLAQSLPFLKPPIVRPRRLFWHWFKMLSTGDILCVK